MPTEGIPVYLGQGGCQEITLDQNDVIVLSVNELFQWEKTANFLNNNKLIENKELEKEKYYLNLRESLLKQGTKAIIFEENNNNKEMGIILDLKIIKKFQLIKNLPDLEKCV